MAKTGRPFVFLKLLLTDEGFADSRKILSQVKNTVVYGSKPSVSQNEGYLLNKLVQSGPKHNRLMMLYHGKVER